MAQVAILIDDTPTGVNVRVQAPVVHPDNFPPSYKLTELVLTALTNAGVQAPSLLDECYEAMDGRIIRLADYLPRELPAPVTT